MRTVKVEDGSTIDIRQYLGEIERLSFITTQTRGNIPTFGLTREYPDGTKINLLQTFGHEIVTILPASQAQEEAEQKEESLYVEDYVILYRLYLDSGVHWAKEKIEFLVINLKSFEFSQLWSVDTPTDLMWGNNPDINLLIKDANYFSDDITEDVFSEIIKLETIKSVWGIGNITYGNPPTRTVDKDETDEYVHITIIESGSWQGSTEKIIFKSDMSTPYKSFIDRSSGTIDFYWDSWFYWETQTYDITMHSNNVTNSVSHDIRDILWYGEDCCYCVVIHTRSEEYHNSDPNNQNQPPVVRESYTCNIYINDTIIYTFWDYGIVITGRGVRILDFVVYYINDIKVSIVHLIIGTDNIIKFFFNDEEVKEITFTTGEVQSVGDRDIVLMNIERLWSYLYPAGEGYKHKNLIAAKRRRRIN